MTGEYIN